MSLFIVPSAIEYLSAHLVQTATSNTRVTSDFFSVLQMIAPHTFAKRFASTSTSVTFALRARAEKHLHAARARGFEAQNLFWQTSA